MSYISQIKEIIEKQDPSIEELTNCFQWVKENGDVGIIKFDGPRIENRLTIFITIVEPHKMFRYDGDNLKAGLIKVLRLYIDSF